MEISTRTQAHNGIARSLYYVPFSMVSVACGPYLYMGALWFSLAFQSYSHSHSEGKMWKRHLIQNLLGNIGVVLNERSVGIEIALCGSAAQLNRPSNFRFCFVGWISVLQISVRTNRIFELVFFIPFACSLFFFRNLGSRGLCCGDEVFSYIHVPCVVCMYISKVRVRESVRDDRVAVV